MGGKNIITSGYSNTHLTNLGKGMPYQGFEILHYEVFASEKSICNFMDKVSKFTPAIRDTIVIIILTELNFFPNFKVGVHFPICKTCAPIQLNIEHNFFQRHQRIIEFQPYLVCFNILVKRINS